MWFISVFSEASSSEVLNTSLLVNDTLKVICLYKFETLKSQYYKEKVIC